MNAKPEHESVDLALNVLEEKEIAELWDVISKYKKELRPWLDWVDVVKTYDEYHNYMNRVRYEESIGIQKNLVLSVDGKAQGEIVFDDFDARIRSCNMGYWISPEYQQQGIMFSACIKAINQAWSSLNVDKINIRFIGKNVSSMKLAKKLGFLTDGVLRKNILYQGVIEDEIVMSLFRNEWKY